MNEDYIGGALLEDIAHTSEDAGSYIGEVLTLFHDVEVDIGCYLKDSEYLIEHLAMLSGDAHDGFKLFGALLELLTSGHILMASGRVPKTNITFFFSIKYMWCSFCLLTVNLLPFNSLYFVMRDGIEP